VPLASTAVRKADKSGAIGWVQEELQVTLCAPPPEMITDPVPLTASVMVGLSASVTTSETSALIVTAHVAM